jgi:hypothetical protein
MREASRIFTVVAAALAFGAATHAFAQAAPTEPEANAPPERLAPLAPAIVEYRWKLLVPQWVDATEHVRARVYAPRWHVARVDYSSLDFRSERRRVGSVAEFHCKYNDLWLPNECRTTWHDVYVDVPVPVLRPDYFEFDVPRWSWRDVDARVDYPRVVWTERTLVVSLPALAVRAARP